MTIRRQMILLIALPTLVIYVAILGVAMIYSYRESRDAVQQSMTQLAASYASRFDGCLREVARIAETTASFMETVGKIPDEKVYEQLQRDVAQSHLVYGAAMAFEPGVVKPADELFSPYVCRNSAGDGFRRINIDRSVYDWYRDPAYTWFTRPKQLGRPVWSEPYFDEGAGNILMTTYSVPFKLEGKFGGVTTVDIDLPRLRKTVGGEFDEDLDFVILDADGRFVYHPNSSHILAQSIFTVADAIKRPELADLGRRMLKGSAGVESIEGWDSPQRQWVFFAPIPSSNWVFACRFPESRVLADVRMRTIWTAGALGLTLLLVTACIVIVSRLVAAPIVKLKDKVVEVGHGNLDVHIDESARTSEIRHLASSFNRMTSELRVHVAHLASEQAARQRIEHDLDVAREIQRGLLPVKMPNVAGFEIAGWSQPADKTGGDYYDWQSLPDGRTLVSLADVSGHGVGPALVTAVCRAYVRASFATGHPFEHLMNQLNDLLIADLPADRFVTFAAAVLVPQQSNVEMISAGHGPILHYIAAERKLNEYHANDLPLGVAPVVQYAPAVQLNMQPGDLLLFITDGFFEWARPDGEAFGLDRLREAVIDAANLPLDQVIASIFEKVKHFTEGTPQLDDVTAVVMRRK